MGFFGMPDEKLNKNQPPVELLHQRGCSMCTLDREARRLENPKMPATGAEKPLVYILGEAPGRVEDEQGRQFVGESGALLREHIPKEFVDYVRWNNSLNCRPPNNRDPTSLELECCRPRVAGDIETAQPDAIFGLGGMPLQWAGMPNGITVWRGRHFPIKVGKHRCWYFPTFHPAFLIHLRQQNHNNYPSNFELAFKFDLKRAFKAVVDGLPEPVIHTEDDARKNIACFTGARRQELDEIADFLQHTADNEDRAGVDYETQNLRPYRSDSAILTAAVSIPGRTIAFAMDHPSAKWSDSNRRDLKAIWKKFLLSRVRKISHHLHFEQEWSAFFYGPETVRSPWECSMTQAYILDERRDGLSLEFLCLQWFGLNIKKITGSLNKNDMKTEPLSKLLPYNGIDAKYHLCLFDTQDAELDRQGLRAPYQEKLRQVPTCVLTMRKGMPVDLKVNSDFTAKYNDLIHKAETEMFALPEVTEYQRRRGETFNPGSDKDVLYLLREILGRDVSNTDKAVLDSIDHPFGKLETAWRNASKMKSTYVDPFSDTRIYPDGLLHPYFGTCMTDTGRLNSTEPNAQNLPKRDEDNKLLRRQIAPPNGGWFMSLDYGQIEARLIAAGSRDRAYCKATWDGYDVHGHWARRIAKTYPDALLAWSSLSLEKQLEKLRDKVKNKFVFPAFFTAALSSVANYMGIPEHILKPEYDQFWRDFAGIKGWQDKIIGNFKEKGYVECFNGRRRRAPLALGQAVNAAIQGSATDVVMDGMNRLSELDIPEVQPMVMIHDDLTFWFHTERDLEDCIEPIVSEMLNVRFPWLCVPLTVDVSIGRNQCDLNKVATYASDKLLGWPVRAKEFL